MRVPKRFVGMHAHTGASTFDGMGPPSDHFKFVLENGLDAHCITDHGHANAFANAFLYVEKMRKENKDLKFKFVQGVEFYTHPSLSNWRLEKIADEKAKESAREAKKLNAQRNEKVKTEIERVADAEDETLDMTNSLTIENEEETKSGKTFNPINRRHHMVMLPKTSRGLKKMFRLVSQGYLEGFYRFPRIDIKMIKDICANENDLIITSACLGGMLSYEVFSQLRHVTFDQMHWSLLDDPSVMDATMRAIGNTFDQYVDAVGQGNFLLELQFNKLPAQDIVNRAIIEFAKRNALTNQLIVTCDSHYARPELWFEREMYKKLGYINYGNINPDSLPKSKDDLKCELYPKNAQQIWDEYNRAKVSAPFYDDVADELVCDAIERTHDIVHQEIGDITWDKSFKFPQRFIPKDKSPFKYLVEISKEGLIKRGLSEKPEYVERLKYELEIIKKMKFSEYFVTLAKMLKLAREVVLLGIARGSAGGSLVAYVLGITDLDPIKYDCRFDRFLNPHRSGAPDIDVDVSDRDKVLDVLRQECGFNNVIPISNYNLFKLKTLVKDISKFYGIPFEEANEATKTVEQDVRKATMTAGSDKNLFQLTFDDAMKYSKSFKAYIDKYPKIADTINVLYKEQRSLGRHAGGCVILDDAMSEMPLIASKGEPQTPWVEGMGAKTLEPLGVIKYDILGLETMRLIERTIELVLNKQKLFELVIGGMTFRLPGAVKLRLCTGEVKDVASLTQNDDITFPLQIVES